MTASATSPRPSQRSVAVPFPRSRSHYYDHARRPATTPYPYAHAPLDKKIMMQKKIAQTTGGKELKIMMVGGIQEQR